VLQFVTVSVISWICDKTHLYVSFVVWCVADLWVCCRCVAGVLQVCCRCVAGVLQVCCRCVAGVLQVCCKFVVSML